MGIGYLNNWGLGIGDWAQSPIPNPQSPIPKPQSPYYNCIIIINYNYYSIFSDKAYKNYIFNFIKKIEIKYIFIKDYYPIFYNS